LATAERQLSPKLDVGRRVSRPSGIPWNLTFTVSGDKVGPCVALAVLELEPLNLQRYLQARIGCREPDSRANEELRGRERTARKRRRETVRPATG
jgi:hypothetical protein